VLNTVYYIRVKSDATSANVCKASRFCTQLMQLGMDLVPGHHSPRCSQYMVTAPTRSKVNRIATRGCINHLLNINPFMGLY
jgi:hypothetical protein